jgi:hypothetical protein
MKLERKAKKERRNSEKGEELERSVEKQQNCSSESLSIARRVGPGVCVHVHVCVESPLGITETKGHRIRNTFL